MLFERIGRSLALTTAGMELLEHTRAMGDGGPTGGTCRQRAGAVDRGAGPDHRERHLFRTCAATGACEQLRQQAPKLEIDVVAANDIRDLMRREADIAIRHVRPEQPDLIARLVAEATAHLYAASDYLDRRGRPGKLADLAGHDFISFGDVDEMLGHYLPMGLPLSHENFRLGSQSGVVAWEYTRQGFGITAMSDEVAEATPGIERVLPDMDPVRFPVWLTTHRELHTSRRIRLVFDVLANFLQRSDRTLSGIRCGSSSRPAKSWCIWGRIKRQRPIFKTALDR